MKTMRRLCEWRVIHDMMLAAQIQARGPRTHEQPFSSPCVLSQLAIKGSKRSKATATDTWSILQYLPMTELDIKNIKNIKNSDYRYYRGRLWQTGFQLRAAYSFPGSTDGKIAQHEPAYFVSILCPPAGRKQGFLRASLIEILGRSFHTHEKHHSLRAL